MILLLNKYYTIIIVIKNWVNTFIKYEIYNVAKKLKIYYMHSDG